MSGRPDCKGFSDETGGREGSGGNDLINNANMMVTPSPPLRLHQSRICLHQHTGKWKKGVNKGKNLLNVFAI